MHIVTIDDYKDRNGISIAEVRAAGEDFYANNGRIPRSLVVTYGCQMNNHDSEKIESMLTQMGYDKAQKYEDADFIIFNTCCVRENAEHRVYGNLGIIKHILKTKPGKDVAICGCMMQQPKIVEEIRRKFSFVNLIFGTHNLHDLPTMLNRVVVQKEKLVNVLKDGNEIVEGLRAERVNKSKAYVNIMYGCNNFCTFCIVPHTRGRERSRMPEDILREVQFLAQNGTKEIMLLGQNVNSYGSKTPTKFAALLRLLAQVDGIERIRFMTSHPKDISFELIDTMAVTPKICNHLHLPLQSGSDKVLKQMNRAYNVEQYMKIVDYLRSKIPGVYLSTDLIVGFPGETDQDFEQTLDLVRQVEYDSAYTYIYSPRTGTPAAKMPQIPDETKSIRLRRLIDTINPLVTKKLSGMKGSTVRVLAESIIEPGKTSKTKSKKLVTGRTQENINVSFEIEDSTNYEEAEYNNHIGKFFDVKITRPKNFSLYGIGRKINE